MVEGATLQDVLQMWAKENQDKITFIQGLGFPLDFLVEDAFYDGESLNVLEPDVDFGRLDRREIALFRSFMAQCSIWSRPDFDGPTDRYLDVQKFDSSVSPSNYAAVEWTTLQKKERKRIMHLRPCDCSWINIRIIHPALNMVAETASHGSPERCDYVLARQLIIVMARSYPLEVQRMDAVNAVLVDYLLQPIGIHGFGVKHIGKYHTDGSAFEYGITVEYKNEKGDGGSDPYLQNVAYHGKYWTGDDNNKRDDYKKHCCPWLLIEVLGQEMGLAGAVYACKRHHAQPLSANVPFLPFPADKDMLLLQARLCMALRVGATELFRFYGNAAKLPQSDQATFPYPRSAKLDGSAIPVDFKYINVWGGIKHRKMLFEAERLDTNAKIMVKFTDTYCKEVHEALYNAGLAPRLHDYQEQAGMFMVVMEYLEEIRPWRDADASNETLKAQLLQVQTVLEESGFVHGDLRAPNVCIQEKTETVFIVDFDWAGKAGEVYYPVVLNPNVTWPRGAKIGGEILMEHDKFMIEEMLGKSDEI
jgi:hypothetical protein